MTPERCADVKQAAGRGDGHPLARRPLALFRALDNAQTAKPWDDSDMNRVALKHAFITKEPLEIRLGPRAVMADDLCRRYAPHAARRFQ